MPSPPTPSRQAVRAAVAAARAGGLEVGHPVVLRDGTNLLVHLAPAPVVARVATGTGVVRSGGAWLSREVAIAGHLSRAGASVVAPSAELSPGPHHRDGFDLSFWQYVPEVDAPLDAERAGVGLRRCHEALCDFPGELPRLAVLDEAERIVEVMAGTAVLGVDDASLLRELAVAVRTSVEALGLPDQPVHGDAHLGNVLITAAGPLWSDWEDCFRGPVAWDLACLHASAPPFGHRDPRLIAAVQAAYGAPPEPSALQTLIEARRFQAATWGVLLGGDGRGGTRERYLTWLRDTARRLTGS